MTKALLWISKIPEISGYSLAIRQPPSIHPDSMLPLRPIRLLILLRVEIDGPRRIWGPIRLSYHSSVCWLWLFGSCHLDSGEVFSVIDQALSYRWLINGCGWGDGSFPFLLSLFFFLFPLACIRYGSVFHAVSTADE